MGAVETCPVCRQSEFDCVCTVHVYPTQVVERIPAPAGRKDDADKPRFSLVPPRALARVVDVLTYGAKKYGANNWRTVAEPERRYLDAALRHLNAHQRGEASDAESGLPHLAHAACCLLFLLEPGA